MIRLQLRRLWESAWKKDARLSSPQAGGIWMHAKRLQTSSRRLSSPMVQDINPVSYTHLPSNKKILLCGICSMRTLISFAIFFLHIFFKYTIKIYLIQSELVMSRTNTYYKIINSDDPRSLKSLIILYLVYLLKMWKDGGNMALLTGLRVG